jgi:hypothetical protein
MVLSGASHLQSKSILLEVLMFLDSHTSSMSSVMFILQLGDVPVVCMPQLSDAPVVLISQSVMCQWG